MNDSIRNRRRNRWRKAVYLRELDIQASDRGYIVPGLDYALCPHDGWVANPWKKIQTNEGAKCNSIS